MSYLGAILMSEPSGSNFDEILSLGVGNQNEMKNPSLDRQALRPPNERILRTNHSILVDMSEGESFRYFEIEIFTCEK